MRSCDRRRFMVKRFLGVERGVKTQEVKEKKERRPEAVACFY